MRREAAEALHRGRWFNPLPPQHLRAAPRSPLGALHISSSQFPGVGKAGSDPGPCSTKQIKGLQSKVFIRRSAGAGEQQMHPQTWSAELGTLWVCSKTPCNLLTDLPVLGFWDEGLYCTHPHSFM